ncbi:MAG: NHLP bacteriocin system secretion protein, partial [Acidobacteriota bacterium]|nr:NHLP bacteriocin system secretion protein [Acidobacteriota bacterium]
GLPLDLLEAEQSLSQQIDDQRLRIQELDLELRELRARLEEDSVLLAPYTGRVVELMVGLGDVVSEGSSVMTLEAVSEELVAVLFVSAADGKRVREGMTARITPSTVREEEFGYMVGRVQRVAEFPSTARGMVRLLANEDLVSRLMEEGPPIQIEVTLERDRATPTGYRWSSSRGPDLEISSGTLANGSVVVRRDRPIRLVLPKLRSDLGL